jgi:glycosyltransferase involved in cell wall biosynthesis
MNHSYYFHIDRYTYGGNETALIRLALELKKNYSCKLILFIKEDFGSDYVLHSLKECFDHVYIYKKKFQNKLINNIIMYFFIRKILSNFNNPIITIFSVSYKNVLLYLFAGFKNSKLLRISAMPNPINNKIKLYIFLSISALFIDKMICVSESVKKWVQENSLLNKSKLVVIPNGIYCNESKYFFDNNKPLTFCMIARMDESKDHSTLISAFIEYNKINNNSRLFLIGDGPNFNFYKKNNFNNNSIFLLGKVDSVNEILSEVDVYVQSSNSEGFPNSLLEAMSFSIPVIASNIPPHLEVLSNGLYGEIFETGNSKSLLDKLLLLSSFELRIIMSNNSSIRSNYYNISKTAKLYIETFHEKKINFSYW